VVAHKKKQTKLLGAHFLQNLNFLEEDALIH